MLALPALPDTDVVARAAVVQGYNSNTYQAQDDPAVPLIERHPSPFTGIDGTVELRLPRARRRPNDDSPRRAAQPLRAAAAREPVRRRRVQRPPHVASDAGAAHRPGDQRGHLGHELQRGAHDRRHPLRVRPDAGPQHVLARRFQRVAHLSDLAELAPHPVARRHPVGNDRVGAGARRRAASSSSIAASTTSCLTSRPT